MSGKVYSNRLDSRR